VVRIDALLIVGDRSSKLHRVVLDMSWCWSGHAWRGGRRCWSACGGGEGLVVAEVMAGERGAEVGGGSENGGDILGGRELPTPPAHLKWLNSMVKLLYVRVEPSSTALSHAHPHPSSNTTSRVMRTHSVPGSRMR
jgi:hypothetical protein